MERKLTDEQIAAAVNAMKSWHATFDYPQSLMKLLAPHLQYPPPLVDGELLVAVANEIRDYDAASSIQPCHRRFAETVINLVRASVEAEAEKKVEHARIALEAELEKAQNECHARDLQADLSVPYWEKEAALDRAESAGRLFTDRDSKLEDAALEIDRLKAELEKKAEHARVHWVGASMEAEIKSLQEKSNFQCDLIIERDRKLADLSNQLEQERAQHKADLDAMCAPVTNEEWAKVPGLSGASCTNLIVAERRRKLERKEPRERVTIHQRIPGLDCPYWQVWLDEVPQHTFDERMDAEIYADGLRFRLAQKEGAQ